MRKRLRREVSVFLALCMVLLLLPEGTLAADTVTTGSCGKNVTYSWDSASGQLTIMGAGAMKDYADSAYTNSSPWYGHRTKILSIIVMDGVTGIGAYAFCGCSQLTAVAIGGSVTGIGDGAFQQCTALGSLVIPNGVTTIGSVALYGCSALTSLTIPDSVTGIGSGAFAHCWRLTSAAIPSGVTVLADRTFQSCSSLAQLSLPAGLTSVGKNALSDCASLTALSLPAAVTSIGDYAFSGCTGLTGTITIPNSVQTLGKNVFSGCTAISQVFLDSPSGSYLFSDCTALQSAALGAHARTVGSDDFSGCKKLAKVTFAPGVESVGFAAFYECASLTGVVLPDGLTDIDDDAFSGCAALTAITFPDSVTSIKSNAFSGCTALGSVTLGGGSVSIGREAFCGCTSLTEISIPNSAASLDVGVFSGCTALKTAVLGAAHIGATVFEGCPLTQLTLGSSVKTVDAGAFSKNTDLKTVRFNGGAEQWCGISFGDAFACPLNYGASLYFQDASGYVSVDTLTIPDTVTAIPDFSFIGCRNLTGLQLPDSVTSIGKCAFSSCLKLSAVNFPSGLTKIGSGAFNCTAIPGVVLPDSVTSVGNAAFESCGSLVSATLSKNLSAIPDSMFESCTYLASVRIPDSVVSVGEAAFAGCKAMKSVLLGKGVKTVAKRAFNSGGPHLTGIYFLGDAPSAVEASSTVSSFPAKATLYYIPARSGWTANTWQEYATATWSGFQADSINPLDFGALLVNQKGYGVAHFLVTGADCQPLPQAEFQCLLSAAGGATTTASVTADDNGILSVKTPVVDAATDFTALFTPSDVSAAYSGVQQKFSVAVSALSYKESWKGTLKSGAEAGLSPGVGASLGSVNLEATLAKLTAGAERTGALEVTDEHSNGKRTLQLNYSTGMGGKFLMKSGIDASACKTVKLNLAGTSGSAKVYDEQTVGLKIPDYEPSNLTQFREVGKFGLQCALMQNGYSVFNTKLAELLNLSSANDYRSTAVLSAGRDTSLLTLELGDEETKLKGGVFAGGVNYALTVAYDNNLADGQFGVTKGYKSSADVGLGTALSAGGSGAAVKGNQVWGLGTSNNWEISAKTGTADNALQELGYRVSVSPEGSVSWYSEHQDDYYDVKLTGDGARSAAAADSSLTDFAGGKVFAADFDRFIGDITASASPAQALRSSKRKQGVDAALSLGASLGLSLDLSLNFSGEHSYSAGLTRSALYGGKSYETAHSDVLMSDVASHTGTLGDLFTGAVKAAWDELGDQLSSVCAGVKDGIKNAYASVTGSVSNWFCSVTSFASGASLSDDGTSYAILQGDGAAALTATVGDPYLVSVWTDSTRTVSVTDAQLSENPLTLTLSYSAAMLTAAGASAGAEPELFRYDADNNRYVLQTAVWDSGAMTVTARITRQGEYVLAVDTEAPAISGFCASDETPRPVLSAQVSDRSGIGDFHFSIDGKEQVVTSAFPKHYNPTTGVFTFQPDSALADGTHTASFSAADTLGNAVSAPVTFTFTTSSLTATILSAALPTAAVTAQSFSVSATTSDDAAFADLTAVVETNDGEIAAYPLTLKDSVWTGSVTGFTGSGTLKVTILGSNGKGTCTEYQAGTVAVSAQAQAQVTASLSSAAVSGTGVQISGALTCTGVSASGTAVAAVYDSAGKMLGLASVPVSLAAGGAQTVELTAEIGGSAAQRVRLFFLNGSGWAPLSTAAEKTVG